VVGLGGTSNPLSPTTPIPYSPHVTTEPPRPTDPTPIVLGDNNLWPFPLAPSQAHPDGGILLVDSGIDFDLPPGSPGLPEGHTTWDSLVQQAHALGFTPQDVRTVIVTHEHIDHAAFAARWAALGATVICGRAAIPALAAGRASNDAQRQPRFDELTRHGAPPALIETLSTLRGSRHLRWDPAPRHQLHPAEDHPTHHLAGGHTLTLVPAPGHTPGNLVALIDYADGSRHLCSGDTILSTTIPTPGLHFPLAIPTDSHPEGYPAAGRWPSLPHFLRSVQHLATLGITRIYPGHGDIIEDPDAYIRRFQHHHFRRGEKVTAALAAQSGAQPGAQSGATAYQLTKAIFPRLPDTRLGQALTEVLGHLDLLHEQSRAHPVTPDDGLVRWILADTP